MTYVVGDAALFGNDSAFDSPAGDLEVQPDDRDYFAERAEVELKRAEAAGHPDASRAHALLAGFYLDLVHRISLRGPDLSRN